MKKKKLSFGLILAGVILLGLSASASAAAAINYVSDNYIAQMDVKSIGVTLNENGSAVSYRNYNHKDDSWSQSSGKLLTNLLSNSGDDSLILNKRYAEALSVTNSGTIDEYVRVEICRYWVSIDADGNETKLTDIDPDRIVLNLAANSGWVEDTKARTTEKSVYYYTGIVTPGQTTSNLTDSFYIDGEIATVVTQNTYETVEDGKTYTNIETVYDYNGVSFVIRASVDAVQTHNAEEAISSAWGIDVTVDSNGNLKLN